MSSRGIRNNNPLNIRKGNNWLGERPVQSDPAFEEFESMQMGIRAALKLMRNQITGFNGRRPKFNTIRKLIAVWAPPTENSTDKYVSFVCNKTGYSPVEIIDPYSSRQMCRIAQAMAQVECGKVIPYDIFVSAYSLI